MSSPKTRKAYTTRMYLLEPATDKIWLYVSAVESCTKENDKQY